MATLRTRTEVQAAKGSKGDRIRNVDWQDFAESVIFKNDDPARLMSAVIGTATETSFGSELPGTYLHKLHVIGEGFGARIEGSLTGSSGLNGQPCALSSVFNTSTTSTADVWVANSVFGTAWHNGLGTIQYWMAAIEGAAIFESPTACEEVHGGRFWGGVYDGQVDDVFGSFAIASIYDTGVATNLKGVCGEAKATSGSAENCYSIYAKAATGGSVSNWSLYAVGNSYFGGDVKLHSSAAIQVDDTQVVGAQGAAVADATDAASAITQLNALLARARTHGLIAT